MYSNGSSIQHEILKQEREPNYDTHTGSGPAVVGSILTLTAMSHENDPDQIAPGDYQLFTPVQTVNQYLAQSPETRKGGHHFGVRPSTASVGRFSTMTLAETIQQGLDELQIASGFEATLDGVVLEDYSYVGEPQLREVLVRRNSLIH